MVDFVGLGSALHIKSWTSFLAPPMSDPISTSVPVEFEAAVLSIVLLVNASALDRDGVIAKLASPVDKSVGVGRLLGA